MITMHFFLILKLSPFGQHTFHIFHFSYYFLWVTHTTDFAWGISCAPIDSVSMKNENQVCSTKSAQISSQTVSPLTILTSLLKCSILPSCLPKCRLTEIRSLFPPKQLQVRWIGAPPCEQSYLHFTQKNELEAILILHSYTHVLLYSQSACVREARVDFFVSVDCLMIALLFFLSIQWQSSTYLLTFNEKGWGS